MQNRALNFGYGTVVIALLAAWSGRGSQERQVASASGEAPSAEGALAATTRDSATVLDDSIVTGTALLERFFGGPLDSLSKCSDGAPCYDLDFLIVMLPDPLDSFLDWSFDADLESMRRAFESARYVTDRFWLPWDADRRVVRDRPLTHYRGDHPGVLLLRNSDPDKHSLRLVYVVGEISTAGVHKRALEAALDERRALLETHRFAISAESADTIRFVGPFFTGSSLSTRLTLRHWQRRSGDTSFALFVSGSATGIGNLAVFDSSHAVSSERRMSFHATVNSDLALSVAMLKVMSDSGLNIGPEHIALLQESSTQYGQQQVVAQKPLSADTADWEALRMPASDRTSRQGALRIRSEPSFDSLNKGMLIFQYPMSISSLRSEYAKHPAPANGADDFARDHQPRIPLPLYDANQQLESPVPLSQLTPASLDLLIDEITRTLDSRDIRAIGLIGTDVRDKMFLGDQLRKRLPDVRLFTFGSSVLYLREDYNTSLRGMLVFSTYPLLLQNQWWVGLSRTRQQRFAFSSDDAEGVFNATLRQLGRRGYREYRAPFDSTGEYPPVWVTAVGRHGFIPIRTFQSLGGDDYLEKRFRRIRSDTAIVAEAHFADSDVVKWLASIVGAAMILFLVLRDDARARARVPIREDPSRPGSTPSSTTNPVRTSENPMVGTRRFLERRRLGLKAALLLHREIYTFLRHLAVLCAFATLAVILVPQPEPYPTLTWVSPIVYWLLSLMAAGAILSFGARIGEVWREWGWAYRDYMYHPPRKWLERVLARARRQMSRIERQQFLDVLSKLSPTIEFEIRALAQRDELRVWRREGIVIAITTAVGIVYAAAVARLIVDFNRLPLAEATLFVHRASQLDSGVSPIFPAIVSSAALAVLCTWQISRLTLLDEVTAFEEAFQQSPSRISPTEVDECKSRIADGLYAARIHLSRVVPQLPSGIGSVIAAMLLGVLAFVLWIHFERSFETITSLGRMWKATPFDVVFRLSILMIFTAAAWALIRLIMVWRALRKTLRALGASPLVTAFERLPRRIARLTRLTLFADPSGETVLSVSATQWMHLQRLFNSNAEAFGQVSPDACRGLRELMADDAPLHGRGHRRAGFTFAPQLTELVGLLERLWATEPATAQVTAVLGELNGQAQIEGASTSGRIRRSFPDAVRLWVRSAEEFVAVQAVDYFAWMMRHLRRIVLMLLFLLVVMMTMLSSYSFLPQTVVRSLFLILFIAVIASLLTVLSQLNRDEVLSRVTRTDPGRLTLDSGFLLNVGVVAAIPMLALLSAFSPVRTDLFGWIDVVLRSLGKH